MQCQERWQAWNTSFQTSPFAIKCISYQNITKKYHIMIHHGTYWVSNIVYNKGIHPNLGELPAQQPWNTAGTSSVVSANKNSPGVTLLTGKRGIKELLSYQYCKIGLTGIEFITTREHTTKFWNILKQLVVAKKKSIPKTSKQVWSSPHSIQRLGSTSQCWSCCIKIPRFRLQSTDSLCNAGRQSWTETYSWKDMRCMSVLQMIDISRFIQSRGIHFTQLKKSNPEARKVQ